MFAGRVCVWGGGLIACFPNDMFLTALSLRLLVPSTPNSYTNASPVPVDRFFGSVHAYVDVRENGRE